MQPKGRTAWLVLLASGVVLMTSFAYVSVTCSSSKPVSLRISKIVSSSPWGDVPVSRAGAQLHRRETVASSACPAWLHDYAVFHTQHRGKADARYLVQLVDGEWQGGLGDRLNGAISMLRLAKALNRVLLIQWVRPYALEEFLQPAAAINWSTRGVPLERGRFFQLIDPGKWVDPVLHDGTLSKIQDQFLTISTNLEINGTCWNCPSIVSQWSKEAACLWQQLFRPTDAIVHQAQAQLMKLYPGPPRQYVAVHLRLGGLTGETGIPGVERGKSPLHNFFAGTRCAAKLARNSNIDLRQTPALVITDNHVLREALLELDLGSLVSPAGLPVHLDHADGHSLQAHQSTFADMVMLGWAQCLVTSRSGFSLHAWLYGGAKPCVLPFKSCL
jgi:hypothetical protein